MEHDLVKTTIKIKEGENREDDSVEVEGLGAACLRCFSLVSPTGMLQFSAHQLRQSFNRLYMP